MTNRLLEVQNKRLGYVQDCGINCCVIVGCTFGLSHHRRRVKLDSDRHLEHQRLAFLGGGEFLDSPLQFINQFLGLRESLREICSGLECRSALWSKQFIRLAPPVTSEIRDQVKKKRLGLPTLSRDPPGFCKVLI